MSHFVNSSKHYLISTNYKVLDSLLYDQPTLREINRQEIRFRGAPIQLNFDRMFKIEAAADMTYLQAELAIDVSQQINNTRQVQWSSPWQPALYAVVNDLYKADFETFQYEMRTV